MFGIIGIVLTFAMVFGGYILAGGKMAVITHSLPFEMMMIGGAAVGEFQLALSTAWLAAALAISQASAWSVGDGRTMALLGLTRLGPEAADRLVPAWDAATLDQRTANP